MSCDLFFTKTCQAYLTKYGTILDNGSRSCHAQSPIKSPLLHWKADPLLIVVCGEVQLRGRIVCTDRYLQSERSRLLSPRL